MYWIGHIMAPYPAAGGGRRGGKRPRKAPSRRSSTSRRPPAKRARKRDSDAVAPGSAPKGPERLQKILARAGYGSRRACEELVLNGRVKVDGVAVTKIGSKANPSVQKVTVDGELVRAPVKTYLLYHKPAGVTTTMSDPHALLTIAEAVGLKSGALAAGVIPVGRLDRDTTGAIILTNDGDFANRVMHPSYGVEKVYRAEVKGSFSAGAAAQLKEGLYLEDGKAVAVEVTVLHAGEKISQVEISVVEGKKHLVRRMLYRVGFPVKKLARVRIGPVSLGRLAVRATRPLERAEIEELAGAERGPGLPGRRKKKKSVYFPPRGPKRPKKKD